MLSYKQLTPRLLLLLAILLGTAVLCTADDYNFSVGPAPTPSVSVGTGGSSTYYYADQGIDSYGILTPASSSVTAGSSSLIPNNTISVLDVNSGYFATFFAILRMKGADGSTPVANRVIARCPNFQGPSINTATQYACANYVDTGADLITALSESSTTVTITTESELPAAAGCTTGPAPYPSIPYSIVGAPWECCTGSGTSNGQCDYDIGQKVTISGATTSGYNVNGTILTHTISGGHSIMTITDANTGLASCSTQSGCSAATNNPAVVDLTMALPTVDYTGSCKGEVTLSGGTGTASSACINLNNQCIPICSDESNTNGVKCPRPSLGTHTFTITGTSTDTIAWFCP